MSTCSNVRPYPPTLTHLSVAEPYFPARQHEVVQAVSGNIAAIAIEVLNAHPQLIPNARRDAAQGRQLSSTLIDQAVIKAVLSNTPAATRSLQEIQQAVRQRLQRSISFDPNVNPVVNGGPRWREQPYVYMALAVTQRADPRFQALVTGFREYMDNLQTKFMQCTKFESCEEGKTPFVALGVGGPASYPSLELMHFAEKVNLVFFDVRQACSLYAWSTFGHEMAHRVFSETPSLQEELIDGLELDGIFEPVQVPSFEHGEIYSDVHGSKWSAHLRRVQNALLSDLLGILYQGPTAVLGFIQFLGRVQGGNIGTVENLKDPHLIDYFRIVFGRAVIEHLPLPKKDKDPALGYISRSILGRSVTLGKGEHAETYSPQDVQSVAETVAKQLLTTPLTHPTNQTLLDLFVWSEAEERRREAVQKAWSNRQLPQIDGLDAAAVVAAAIHQAIFDQQDEMLTRNHMLATLLEITKRNPRNRPRDALLQFSPPPSMEAMVEATKPHRNLLKSALDFFGLA